MDALMQRPEIEFAQTSFNTSFPQYKMEIDVPRAEGAGVSVSNILSVMQGYIGGVYAADFSKYGKQYRVMVQALPEARKDPQSLNELYVRTRTGQMTPIAQFVTLNKVYGPQSLNRYNLFTSVKITGANAEGYSTGNANQCWLSNIIDIYVECFVCLFYFVSPIRKLYVAFGCYFVFTIWCNGGFFRAVVGWIRE